MDVAQLLGWAATFLFTICYIPQILKTLKTNTVDGLSLALFVIQFVANIIALVYASLIGQFPLVVKYSLAIIFVGLVIIVYVRVAIRTRERTAASSQ